VTVTPQIVSYDGGVHNADLSAATSRIVEGGSWKKQRTVVLIPAARKIDAKVALSHWNLLFPPNQAVHRMLCLGMEVGEAYSEAIAQVLAHPDLSQWEFLLTLEHDNVPQPDALLRLIGDLERHPEYVCVGGLYWTKGYGGVPQIWGDPKDPVVNFRPQPPRPGELVECCGTGMGFNLWRLSLFRDARLRRPWFKTLTGIEGQGMSTQDLYFWGDARKYGYRCAVDCGVLVGHYDAENDVTW
jgi:hypothetical protein